MKIRTNTKSLFRTEALNNLNRQEEADVFLEAIGASSDTKLWLWLALLFFLGISLWGCLGSIALSVNGSGIILPAESHIFSLSSDATGVIDQVFVHTGDTVKKGQLLAHISIPESTETLHYLQLVYAKNAFNYNQFKQHYLFKKMGLNTQFRQESLLLTQNIRLQKEKIQVLEYLLKEKNTLYKRHYVNLPDLEQAKESLYSAQNAYNKMQLSLKQLALQHQEDYHLLDEQMNTQARTLLESEHLLKLTEIQVTNNTTLVSPYDGSIFSLALNLGDKATPGKALILGMTHSNKTTLNAIVFVDHVSGKKILKGMKAYLIKPNSTIYDHHYAMGIVSDVSDFPSTRESAMSYLGNTDVVNDFFRNGTPFMVTINIPKTQQLTFLKPGSSVITHIIYQRCTPWKLLSTC